MNTRPPNSFKELGDVNKGAAPWRLNIVAEKISGGQLTPKELEIIDTRPDATALLISGLRQDTFEILVEQYGNQFKGLYLWKSKLIEDLSPLERMPQLTHVSIYWNQRATRFWNFTRTPNLRGLQFMDFSRLHDLSDLSSAVSLEELTFGNKVWPKSIFDSLEPISSLKKLKQLIIVPKGIEDSNIAPLAQFPELEWLSFEDNLFTTSQIAWLRARLSDEVDGYGFEPDVDNGEEVRIPGRGKRALHRVKNAKRIAERLDEFWAQVQMFRDNLDLDPEA